MEISELRREDGKLPIKLIRKRLPNNPTWMGFDAVYEGRFVANILADEEQIHLGMGWKVFVHARDPFRSVRSFLFAESLLDAYSQIQEIMTQILVNEREEQRRRQDLATRRKAFYEQADNDIKALMNDGVIE